ncbi:hypothetical protein LZ578_09615 [Jeotgalibaca sp. MA1X17-3]|uniref:DUF1659 domain-containing protein n=1 Tax=Jeotgalibaca sp. MA1X17-3 TaxID=2908211 RepID=UPI001F281BBD|nr:hypothetical protein [Jeotgalibaca sp. MA1X17-3]UJF15226.1 hypothetical protein LZ578_09615 [Jeotgalibaca sp. MA1X17-3]
MLKQWEQANVELYFNDFENEKEVKQSFSSLKENVTPEQIGSFQDAVSSLIKLPAADVIVVEKHRYLKA